MDGGEVTQSETEQLETTDPEIVPIGLFTMDDAAGKVSPSLAKRIAIGLSVSRNGGLALCDSGTRVA
ncbi:MAG: hypothetical protein J2P17_24970 [Mycobacterium sp.]|nr:hypothetical protein [Mycobacterium sp.]